MLVKRIMSASTVTVSPQASLTLAARLMRSHDIGALPVVDESGLIGMVTDRDLVVRAFAAGHDLGATTVGDIASKPVHVCHVDDDMENAVAQMARHQVRRVPVVDDAGALVGMVALSDVARQDDDCAGFAVGEVSEPVRIFACDTFEQTGMGGGHA